MPEPTEFLVVQDAQSALQAIAIASGYHHDVAALAVKLDPNVNVEALLGESALRPFLILELTPDEFVYSPSMQVAVRMPFIVHAVHEADVEDDSAWIRTYFRLCADVEQAFAVDITRAGLATDTRIATREFQSFGGSQVWAMVKGAFDVRRTYGAPNG